MTVWIALDDVSPALANGTLEVVPGSHRIERGWSGSNSPDHIRPYERYLRERLEPLTLVAGDAVVYDTRLLHASAPNRSSAPRVALACALAPAGEDLIHVAAHGNTVSVHRVTPVFFTENHPRDIEVEIPTAFPVVDQFEDDIGVDPAEIEAIYGASPFTDPVVPHDVRQDADPERFDWLEHIDAAEPGGRAGVVRVDQGSGEVVATPDGLRLGAGARATIEVGPASSVTLVAVDAPPVGGGICLSPGAADLVPGRAVVVPALTPLRMWNDGPQDLVVRILVPLSARRRLLRRLHGLRPRRR